jgi:holo-[acyl-carrier protein] synthase
MIIGIGNDIIRISRIQSVMNKFEDKFLERVFSPYEREKCKNRRNRAACFAKRYAAKEALSKAIGTGFKKGVYWRDIGVVNGSSGKPRIILSGGALSQLEKLTPLGFISQIDLTITDELPFAEAFVIISALNSET